MAQERGSQVREESVAEQARRLSNTAERTERRRQFLNSDVGVRASKDSFAALPEALQVAATEAGDTYPVKTKSEAGKVVVLGKKLGLSVVWRLEYANSLKDSALKVEIWNGHPPLVTARSIYDDQKKRLHTANGGYDHDGDNTHGWKMSGDGRILSINQFAEFLLKELIEAEFNAL
jgi:hypothetical protein